MTVYETVMVILGIITLMITFAKFIITLLSFAERKEAYKK